jgi:hypothetical protein
LLPAEDWQCLQVTSWSSPKHVGSPEALFSVKFEVVRSTQYVGNFLAVILPYYSIHRNWQGPTPYPATVIGQNVETVGELGLTSSHKFHSNFIPNTFSAVTVNSVWQNSDRSTVEEKKLIYFTLILKFFTQRHSPG